MSNAHARHRVKTDAYIALCALKSKYKESKGNGPYAAEAWVLCRQANIKPPEWVLDAVDVVARVNRFALVSGVAEGRRTDGERKVLNLLAATWKKYWGNVRLNETSRIDWLRIDQESLASVVKKWRSEVPHGGTKGARIAIDGRRERLAKSAVARPSPDSSPVRPAAGPGWAPR